MNCATFPYSIQQLNVTARNKFFVVSHVSEEIRWNSGSIDDRWLVIAYNKKKCGCNRIAKKFSKNCRKVLVVATHDLQIFYLIYLFFFFALLTATPYWLCVN